jgi:hypothetical protein
MFLSWPKNVSLIMFLSWPRNISSYVPRCHVAEGSYVPQCHMAEEHNLCSSASMSMWSYVRQDIFLSYIPWLVEKHNILGFLLGNIYLFPVVLVLTALQDEASWLLNEHLFKKITI